MSSSTAAGIDELRTLSHAQEAACLLQPILQKPELARVQTLRAHELQENLGHGNRKKLCTNSAQACSFCGASIVSGWTGCIQLHTIKPGRRTRKREAAGDSGSRNRVVWTCKACGCSTTQSGSDPNTKSKFKAVKKHKPLAILLAQAASRPSPSLSRQQSASTPAPQAATVPGRSTVPTTAVVTKQTPLPVKTLKTEPSSSAASQKKKRSKREGLQAMLQAKKEQDEKAKQAAGSLGLSSFLKGLQ